MASAAPTGTTVEARAETGATTLIGPAARPAYRMIIPAPAGRARRKRPAQPPGLERDAGEQRGGQDDHEAGRGGYEEHGRGPDPPRRHAAEEVGAAEQRRRGQREYHHHCWTPHSFRPAGRNDVTSSSIYRP